jgi:hypothetical protein
MAAVDELAVRVGTKTPLGLSIAEQKLTQRLAHWRLCRHSRQHHHCHDPVRRREQLSTQRNFVRLRMEK